MDLQMANGRHLLIGLDLLVANVSPGAPSAPNKLSNNESALHCTRKLCLQKSLTEFI